MERPPLTPNEQTIWDHIIELGYVPSQSMVAESLGFKSTTSVSRAWQGLVKKNRLEALTTKKFRIIPDAILKTDWTVPFLGQVAAGEPTEVYQQDERIDFEPLLKNDDHFVVRVSGESMVDAGILDGDLVVVERRNTCRIGDIGAFLVDDENEVTLKRLVEYRGKKRLKPENSEMKLLKAARFQVLGVMVGIVRTVKPLPCYGEVS
jgi:repressor LexA